MSFEKVKEFHQIFGAPFPTRPTLYPYNDIEEDKKLHKLRVDLIQEELDELKEALEAEDIVEVADALADLKYVVEGAMVAFGLPSDELLEEVHRSNMSKLDENGRVLRREDGKILKSPLFSKPDLKSIINKHR